MAKTGPKKGDHGATRMEKQGNAVADPATKSKGISLLNKAFKEVKIEKQLNVDDYVWVKDMLLDPEANISYQQITNELNNRGYKDIRKFDVANFANKLGLLLTNYKNDIAFLERVKDEIGPDYTTEQLIKELASAKILKTLSVQRDRVETATDLTKLVQAVNTFFKTIREYEGWKVENQEANDRHLELAKAQILESLQIKLKEHPQLMRQLTALIDDGHQTTQGVDLV